MTRFFHSLLLVLLALPVYSGSISRARALFYSGKPAMGRTMLEDLYRNASRREVRAAALYYLAVHESSIPGRIGRLTIFMKEFPGTALDTQARVLLARALFMSGRTEDGIRTAMNGLAADRNGSLRFELARFLIKSRKYGDALVHLNVLIARGDAVSDPAGTAYLRGYCLLQLGRHGAALRALEKMLRSYRGSSWEAAAVLHVAEVHYRQKRYRTAGHWFSRVLKEYPNSLSGITARSRMLLLSRMVSGPVTAGSVYEVQAAAFRDRVRARKQSLLLGRKGFRSRIHRYVSGGTSWFSVRIGPFRSRREAAAVLARLKRSGFDGFIRKRTVRKTEE